jgi:hypothetical protein
MYHPVIKSKFSEVIHIDNGQVSVDPKGRKQLLMHVNDNVYKNIEHFSLSSFDQKSAVHKDALGQEEKAKLAD